jgi:hypothetical protein
LAGSANEFVRDFGGFRIIRQLQEDIHGPVQGLDRSPAIADEIIGALGRFTPVALLLQKLREIVDALLIAGFALELLQAQPNVGIARNAHGQSNAEPRVDACKDLVLVLVEIAGTRAIGRSRYKEQRGTDAAASKHPSPRRIISCLPASISRLIARENAGWSNPYIIAPVLRAPDRSGR